MSAAGKPVLPDRQDPIAASARLETRPYSPPKRWSAREWRMKVGAVASVPAGSTADTEVLVAGTWDTKARELNYLFECLVAQGLRVRRVDLSTTGHAAAVEVGASTVAACNPGGVNAVFTNDRGGAITAMSVAFEQWISRQHAVGGVISAGGSGATALATPAMRRLAVGIPKIMISTVASGDVGLYVGPSDLTMMYPVTDVQGLNRISRQVLSNGANALAGMVKARQADPLERQPATGLPLVGMTMFGVTTPAVQQLTDLLQDRYECLVFHATGTGGRSMEKLADDRLLSAAVDLTTTEVCDLLMGGVFPCTEDRFGAFIRTRIPYVGSVGALDMVNFGPRATVPAAYADRKFVEHNQQVTLMRTTPDENSRMGRWIAARLNEMTGPVAFLIPEGGVSALDAPGQPFFDPVADRALFDSIESTFQTSSSRRLIRVPHHINSPGFAAVAAEALDAVSTH